MKTRCLICGKDGPYTAAPYHATCARNLFGARTIPVLDYTQADINRLATSIIAKRISVPGVQPKLSIHLEKGTGRIPARMTLVGLEGGYILKPQTPLWRWMPEAEHFAMLFARLCRIRTADFGLVPLASGERAYLTKRMDRTANGMLHMEDFCQLTNKMTAQKYNGSMEQVGKAVRNFSNVPGLDATRLLELTLFCFLIGNSDMHLKNFSLIHLPDATFELSPAYDLLPVKILMPQDKEELALTVNGKKARLTHADFATFAQSMKLSPTQFERTLSNLLTRAQTHIGKALQCSFLPDNMKRAIQRLLTQRLARLQK